MKKKVASRKLKRTCSCCNKAFSKGETYHIDRRVIKEFGEIFAFEYLICPKCKYKAEQSRHRFLAFISDGKCKHPITDIVWTTIAGEDYVKEPSHTECCICGEVV
ncbi:hypothetical protein [Paenibacillus xylaniclasticus]|uniref:hypothetical protein n=1 Tax=Paenibacillus xylaniclasticus TaxID=588083 RepID=UPI000FD93C29|nr:MULTISPECIES: hypothetical protein [Paenibacillus]GFN32414.1 hypothetical protein PCURB6_26740 [Paenibacillus curdlanolyticus]